jgi:diazepam-binding inhibitor (GABA receptor modulating acyl-CoA-binding protein)
VQEDFKAAADSATKDLPESMSNDDKLLMYGLYKQATVGDVNSCKIHCVASTHFL